MITSVQRATLIPGGFESLVYTTLSGSIGVLLPFASNEVKTKEMCEMMTKNQSFTIRIINDENFCLFMSDHTLKYLIIILYFI
jgi:hypothetical protein